MSGLLKEYRNKIDEIDDTLVFLLGERFKITDQIGVLKSDYNLPPQDKAREKEQAARLKKIAEENLLDPKFVEKFHNFIVDQVIKNHKKISQEQP